MLADFIKFSSIYFGSIYICIKIMNYTFTFRYHKLILSIIPYTLSVLTYFLSINIAELTFVIPLLLLWLSISFFTLQPQQTFVSVTVAFGISYCIHAVASFIMLLVIFPTHLDPPSFQNLALAIPTTIVQALFTITLFRIKRFRKGMPFLISTTIVNIATFVCLFLITFLMYIQFKGTHRIARIATLLISIATLTFVIYWWQSQLTKSYKRALLLRELESLRTELQEKDKLISELTSQNEQLGRLIHKDNKLIPAMENAVCEYLVSDFADAQATLDKGNTLLLEVRNLSNSRTNIISEIYATKCKQFSTGISSLDTLLNYMDKRANQDNIKLSVHIALELNEHIPRIISAEDLVHLLSDLLENAFIATNQCPNRTVQLQFYQSQKAFVIEVADSEIPFEVSSLTNFGTVQLTTHADTGGSGIGLIDIWKIKDKYRASLHITEYEMTTPFSKKISLIFNKKNQYSIETWRKEEIAQASKRNDFLIYDYKD